MSLKEALVFEVACTDKDLEQAKQKVKTLQKRLRYLRELLEETDKPFNPHEEIDNG